MTDPRINLKNPWLAGLFAFLLPGAGQLYQGRYFKGVLFLVCILGTFVYGMQLGEWRPFYWTENAGQLKFGRPAKRNFGFLAQAGMGTPAVIAYLQSRRYHSRNNAPVKLNYPNSPDDSDYDLTKEEIERKLPLLKAIDAKFSGIVLVRKRDENENLVTVDQPLQGQIHLEPHNGSFRGTFQGTMIDTNRKEQSVSWNLGGSLFVDSRVLGNPKRAVRASIMPVEGEFKAIKGSIPREFLNRIAAPLDNATLQDLNGRLNKRFEMALVYTWIAGLLNILAIWDAVQGPAYGYGDEPPPEKESTDKISTDESGEKSKRKAAAAEKEDEPPDKESPRQPIVETVASDADAATSKGKS